MNYCSLYISDYCSQVWSPINIGQIAKIERIQRYFTRRLYARMRWDATSYQNRLDRLKLVTLEQRRLTFDLSMVYRLLHNEVSLSFEKFFRKNHRPSRGHKLQLQIERANTNVRSQSFSFRSRGVWNALPKSVGTLPVVMASN